ncbi:hypothetical protein D3C72_2541580 [compost metagenome]
MAFTPGETGADAAGDPTPRIDAAPGFEMIVLHTRQHMKTNATNASTQTMSIHGNERIGLTCNDDDL